MAVIGGVFVGAVAHTRLSTDLSVAAGALAAGLIVQCQRSAGALEMREFISFAANMAVEQGGRYGMFIIFLIFLIRGIAGTPASSSGASGHLDIVLDAGAPPPPPSRSRSRSRTASRSRHTDTPPNPLRRLRRARGRVSPLIPPRLPAAPGTLLYSPPPTTPDEVIVAMPLIEELAQPRADLLTFEQARQMHLELSAGMEPLPNIPPSITETLAIVDTGCATSMAPLDDFFEPGSIYRSDVNVVGASGGLKLDQRGTLRYPMCTVSHGTRKWKEKGAIKNKNCPYVLLAAGRSSIEHGTSLHMPGYGGDGTLSFMNGVTVTVYNRKVLALRPLGYKAPPSSALALVTTELLGIPSSGDFVFYIGSGPPHESDIAAHASELGVEAFIVFIDPLKGGEAHDITKRPTVAAMLIGAKLPRCRGAIISIRCKSWSVAVLMPKPDGTPGTELRRFPNAIEGVARADGTLPRSVTDGNTETEHVTEIAHAIVKHDGFLLVETPTRRRAGSTHFARHALAGAERHAHMLDHPAWVRLTELTGAREMSWDQCTTADVAEGSPIKSSIWWATPNIYPIVCRLFGDLQCFHPAGTHTKLKGVDANGRY